MVSPGIAAMEKSAVEPESFILTRWVFFRLMGVIHLMAFGSYATQIIGLNGEHGILPTQDLLRLFSGQFFKVERCWTVPTVAWINCSDAALMAMTSAGIFFALLVCAGIATGPSLIALMILWLSVVAGGGEFTGFQSDGMLVEVTFLSLFFVTWRPFEPPWPVPLHLRQQTKPSFVGLWLLRFMIFRMMFASGLVKILSGDPTWHSFTAMNYHFETQPIPTPLAWYAHQLPQTIHSLMVLHMYVAELLAPVLIFIPGISRLIAAAIMASLHMGIALTGNYTFLNFLSIVLCVPLVSDRWWRRIMPQFLCRAVEGAQVEGSPSRLSKIL